MQTESAERRRHSGRRRRGESGHSRAEPRGSQRSSGEEITRLKEVIAAMQQKEKQAGERGQRAEKEGEDDERRGRDRSRGDGGRRSRRTASEGGEGGEESGRLRWRVHQLEKERLELTSGHNQELCRLQAELTRLRSSVERGEAQRVELQYQLTVSQRDADRVSELSRDKQTLTERTAELQQTVQELQKALDITRQARDEDQHALQQEVEERDRFIQSFSSENQRLHRLLQDQEEALEESERRMTEVQKELEKEAQVNKRQADELKYLSEREERSQREKEVSDQRVKSLESSVEAERAAHLESKFNSEIIQLRVRDLEAALAAERSGLQEAQSGLELLRSQFREVERAYGVERERRSDTEHALQRLQKEYERCKFDLSAALQTERTATSDLTERLEDEKRQHANTHTLLQQAAQRQTDTEDSMRHIRETLQQHSTTDTCPPAKDDGNRSPSAELLWLLETTLSSFHRRQETVDGQIRDLLSASERLREENLALRRLTSDQSRQLQASVRLEEEVSRLRQESSDWSTQSRSLQAELETEREEREREREEREREREEREEREREREEREREREEREREREREREEREREREEREREREEREREEREREERERERERESEREREEKTAAVRRITDHYEKESKVRLSFLCRLYQRLLAGCVLLDQPQSILGDFTWKELCDIIDEQVDRLTFDLREANNKIAHLQSVCEKKSVCVRQLQRSQECVLSRLEESMRRREEAWSSQHTHTVTQLQNELQLCRSQFDSLRGHASSLELRASSLTSDLSRLRGLLSRRRRESSCFLSASVLLAGTLRHTHRRLQTLCAQKTLLCRRLAEREVLEEEVRRLAAALGGKDDEEEEVKRRRSRAVRRWRRSVCVVLAVRRWRALSRRTTVMLRLERGGGGAGGGGGGAVCVCGEATAARKGQNAASTGEGDEGPEGREGREGREGVCARWLRSKSLSSIILSAVADLQEALTHTGSSPPDVTSAARSALSRLLDHLLDQSDAASGASPCRVDEDTLSGRLRVGLSRLTPLQPDIKALVSTLQQHFLLFSQRLHSAEVERRSLRLEVANLKRGLRQEREETVPAQRFHSVCAELRQALSREQEAQTLVQEQTDQLQTLQRRVDAHTSEQTDTQRTLSQTTQSLSEARQEVSRKERSLRIVGKHLSAVQRERTQLEERLRRAEDERGDAVRLKDFLMNNMKAAETSYKEVRESLVQSRCSLSAQPRPLPLPREHLELSGAESIMGAPEVAAWQSFLSSVSSLFHTCSSRIDWLEQEVSAHRSHVTALRCELQDACLRDNQAFVPVDEFPEKFLFADVEKINPVSPSDLSKEPSMAEFPKTCNMEITQPVIDLLKEPSAGLRPAPSVTDPAPSVTDPAPSSALCRPFKSTKTKPKKSRAARRHTAHPAK